MRILAIDGAIAHTGIALVDTAEASPGRDLRDSLRLSQAAAGLVATARWSTPAGEASLLRCRDLGVWLAGRIRALKPDLVIAEVPAKDGSYARVQKRQAGKSPLNARSEALLNRGIGALAGAIPAGITLLELPADRQPKDARKERVNQALRMAGKRALTNSHEADAAWIALYWAGAFLGDPSVFETHVAAGVLHAQAQLRAILG